MNIKPYDKTIRDLFVSGRQFVIPRFQREYSWDKKNYQEFYEDMMNNLTISKGKITANQYFLGTMLFIGNFSEGTDQEIYVVDGQQRLTTITILFSALSDVFHSLNENKLSEQIFKYVMTKDDNGEDVRILKSKTHYPFFAYYIQDIHKSVDQQPNTEEETCIKETYDFFISKLNEKQLKSMLSKRYGSEIVENISLIEILKALRDQVLNSTFVSISTTDKDQANKIFEILNAKGKRLAHIDLIKNKIFEVLNETEPADFADDRWQKLKDILNNNIESIGLATFYRHYWISKYKKTSTNKLYDDFSSNKQFKTRSGCIDFLEDMIYNAKNYMKIVCPQRSDYENRKEYFWLVQSLHSLNSYFNIAQVRIALLALFDVKDREIISSKMFKHTIQYLENFHFAYNAVVSGRANKLEKIYSSFAIELRKCESKEEVHTKIENKLFAPLDKIFPSLDEFSSKFIKLSYTKKENPLNVKTKYAINKLNCYYSQKEIFEDDGSVEHLYPECKGECAYNIGNLILLEGTINNDAGDNEYTDKISHYNNSQYKWIKQFCSENPVWDDSMIEERANMMAETYYHCILGKENN